MVFLKTFSKGIYSQNWLQNLSLILRNLFLAEPILKTGSLNLFSMEPKLCYPGILKFRGLIITRREKSSYKIMIVAHTCFNNTAILERVRFVIYRREGRKGGGLKILKNHRRGGSPQDFLVKTGGNLYRERL